MESNTAGTAMSDQKLRELERKWKETGSVEDEAAYLRERVRVGDLTQERLELAAYCGHAGAVKSVPVASSRPESHQLFARALATWGLGVQVKASLVAAQLLFRQQQILEPGYVPRLAMEAVQAWVEDPSDETAGLVKELQDYLQRRPLPPVGVHPGAWRPGDASLRSCADLLARSVTATPTDAALLAEEAMRVACEEVERRWPGRDALQSIRKALADWALKIPIAPD